MLNLDTLIDEACIYGELSTGTDATWLAKHSDSPLVSVLANTCDYARNKAPEWTAEEDAYLRRHYLYLSDAEIAAHLGRSEEGVHIRREREMGLTPRTKHPDWVTGQQVAEMLGVPCQKTVARWMNDGFLPSRSLNADSNIRVVYRPTLWRWTVNPRNWVYFDTSRVQHPHLRRLIHLKRQRWGDDWWTTGQVAAYHGVDHQDVQRYIMAGKLPAVRWQNWQVLRSEATRPGLIFKKSRGTGHELDWSADGDAFLVLGTALGYSNAAIAAMMGWENAWRTEYRRRSLRNELPEIARALGVQCRDGVLYADWRHHRRQFKRLAQTMDAFLAGEPVRHLALVTNTLQTALRWHARNDEQHDMARRMTYWSKATRAGLDDTYQQLLDWGIQP